MLQPAPFLLAPAWLRPLQWAVRGAAAVIIVVSAVRWFGPPAPGVAPGVVPGVVTQTGLAALRADISLPLAGGRRLAFYLGPGTAADLSARDATGRAAGLKADGPTDAAPRPAGGDLSRAAADHATTAARMCMLGNGVIEQASFSLGAAGTVSAFGLDDVAAVSDGARDDAAEFTLPLLQRVHAQGALAALRIAAEPMAAHPRPLPNILAFADSAGVGDYAMGVANGVVDFLIVGGGDYASELNPWYHSLNAGMRTQIVGDMPCNDIAGSDAVASRGAGLTRPAWLMRRSFSQQVSYVSDGHSRLIDFAVDGHQPGPDSGSEVRLARPGVVSVTLSLAAELPVSPAPPTDRDGWQIEKARQGASRAVTLDIVVNGRPVASRTVLADGAVHTVALDLPISRSSWVAVRLPGAGHSNPVYVLVDNRPVRGSRASVEWNIQALTRAYEAGAGWGMPHAALANAAYDYAFAIYNHILHETSEP